MVSYGGPIGIKTGKESDQDRNRKIPFHWNRGRYLLSSPDGVEGGSPGVSALQCSGHSVVVEYAAKLYRDD